MYHQPYYALVPSAKVDRHRILRNIIEGLSCFNLLTIIINFLILYYVYLFTVISKMMRLEISMSS
jgi:hypothetical protein